MRFLFPLVQFRREKGKLNCTDVSCVRVPKTNFIGRVCVFLRMCSFFRIGQNYVEDTRFLDEIIVSGAVALALSNLLGLVFGNLIFSPF